MTTRTPAAESFSDIARRMREIQRSEDRNPRDFFEEARREIAGAPISASTDYDAATLGGMYASC